MPAPVTPVLDTFNGVAGTILPTYNPLWQPYLTDVVENAIIAPDQLGASRTGAKSFGGNYWNQVMQADQEQFFTVKALSSVGHGWGLDLRVSAPAVTSTVTRYICQVILGGGGNDTWNLFWTVGGGGANLIATASKPSLSVGDRLWASAIGSTLSGYRYSPSTGWVLQIQATDTHITTGGLLAWDEEFTAEIGDWGGGNVGQFGSQVVSQGLAGHFHL